MNAADDVVDTIELRPDPGLVKSIGVRHRFESAVADLVDNCVDAGATRVTVCLLTYQGNLMEVQVIDNGRGMDSVSADEAMRLGRRRSYGHQDLGHFGVGLKAASLACGDVLTVWSKHRSAPAVGRRIRRGDFESSFRCEVLDDGSAHEAADSRRRVIGREVGTTVIWTELRNVYGGGNPDDAKAWLYRLESDLTAHLGVTFHRLLNDGRIEIKLDVADVEVPDESLPMSLDDIDPFGYPASGHPEYPKKMTATVDGRTVEMECHIWPHRRDIPGFRLYGRAGEDYQGLYIYSSDRLLQVGGWSNLTSKNQRRGLARVVVDDASLIGSLMSMNPEKDGIRLEQRLVNALHDAQGDDGTTFEQFLEAAESTRRQATRRSRRRQAVATPGKGFGRHLRRQIEDELPLRETASMSIRWKNLPNAQFFETDPATNTLWLNQRNRQVLAPNGSLNDVPVIKALLFLLAHDLFEGSHFGPKDKDNIALWDAVLGAALEDEWDLQDARDTRP